MLKGKTVVVGVCGGIAAYKVVDVISRLKKLEADVFVVMTDHATKFVTPLTFQSISHNPVFTEMFNEPKKWDIEHIALAQRADIIVIVPATANVIGKIANGIADDLLTTTVMATKAPVFFAPAMNYHMYENRIVQNNISNLQSLGYHFMEPDTGMMAEGTSGKGRLPEPQMIVEKIKELLNPTIDMKGLKVLITAGPTREPIDPVRYISNRSSGKMGYAIAEAASLRGAEVTVVSGPVNIKKLDNIKVIEVITAEEMYQAVRECYESVDVVILAAAVADYKSAVFTDQKIKKTNENMSIEMTKNPDIAMELGKIKQNKIHVGFCAETEHLMENAKGKLEAKNFDMIVANDVTMEGAGFETDTNIVKIIKKDFSMVELPIMRKTEVAQMLLDEVVKMVEALK